MNKFESYGLNPKLLKGIQEMGFEKATPIQEKSIPFLLEHKRDLIALAQTGTGKTAAFGIPLLQNAEPHGKTPQYLILCPTRELCVQIATELEKFCKYMPEIHLTAIYGGANIDSQIKSLKRGTHLIVATPGRMQDIIRRKKVDLGGIKTVVLDEADEMLNMGFQEDLNSILSETPKQKNTLLFSATMSKEIANIAMDYMVDPLEITVGKKNVGSKNIRHMYYLAHIKDKYAILKRILDLNADIYGIIFCRTRHETKDTADLLMKDGYDVDALHGDLSHAQRESVMSKFRHKNLQILVATDVAARGLDVTNLTHIIHYNLPEELELYTHRSGRTGRKDATGTSIAIISPRDIGKIKRIEKIIEQQFTEAPIPEASQILESRIASLARRIEGLEVDHKHLSPHMNEFYKKLENLDKDEIIQRFLTIELKPFLDFYKNGHSIKAPDKHSRDESRSGGNRSFGGGKPFRKGGSSGKGGFSQKSKSWKGQGKKSPSSSKKKY
ncbi:MAG: DEAD/DEAH box helicase [Spirochaetia bacterium]|nr:DEAD/DEAH box helicase [Spirochaetia bacterium]